MEPPSARPWLGLGAALSALPAAGGCFCAALVLAVVADSDPGAVYEQHRWLGAIVAASAVCAYVAMMGWATLRHGGLPAPVLLIALVLAGAPFLLPGRLLLPAAALAVAGCAALVTVGLANPPATPDGTRIVAIGLTGAAFVLAITQAVGVGLTSSSVAPRVRILAATPHPAMPAPQTSSTEPGGTDAGPARADAKPSEAADDASSPAKDVPDQPAAAAQDAPAAAAPDEPVAAAETPATAEPVPDETEPEGPVFAPAKPTPAGGTPAPAGAAPPPAAAEARKFVRDYYAALDARQFAVAWNMLAPEVQSRFGTFEGWRKGYARTVSHAADGLTVAVAGAGATVGLTLRAGDRGACGTIAERRFAVTWRLARTDAGWRATAASARKLSGPEPC